jgi:hypothetical protein
VALEPSRIVDDVTGRSQRVPGGEPPAMLRHPPGVGDPLPSIQAGDEVSAIHRDWAQLHAPGNMMPGGDPHKGLRSAVRARLAAVTAAASRPAHEADRALIGDLIRAVDALAARVDVLGGRVLALEALVEEVVLVTSQDLAQVRAAVVAKGGHPPVAQSDGG